MPRARRDIPCTPFPSPRVVPAACHWHLFRFSALLFRVARALFGLCDSVQVPGAFRALQARCAENPFYCEGMMAVFARKVRKPRKSKKGYDFRCRFEKITKSVGQGRIRMITNPNGTLCFQDTESQRSVLITTVISVSSPRPRQLGVRSGPIGSLSMRAAVYCPAGNQPD